MASAYTGVEHVDYYLNVLYWYLGIQAIIGFLAVEFALSRFSRFMEKDEARDCNFPAFRRYDAPNFARWKFYPLALLTMPTRIVLVVLTVIVNATLIS